MVLLNDEFNSSSSENDDEFTRRNGNNCNSQSNNNEQRQQESTFSDHNSIPRDNTETLTVLLQSFKRLTGLQIRRTYYFVMLELGGYKLVDSVVQWCVQHPQIAICVLAAVLVTFLPVLLFIAFAFSTFIMTLTGFLVLEGTLLTILTMVLFGLLGALALVLLLFALVAVATYFGFAHVYDIFASNELHRITWRNFMPREPQNSNQSENLNQTSQHENAIF